jgi:nucleoside-diphosphate-sugar epimerase
MTIYVTGSAGFIGSHFIEHVRERAWTSTSVDRDSGHRAAIGLDTLNMSELEILEKLAADVGPEDVIVLLGAHPEVALYADDPGGDVVSNVLPIVNQIHAAQGAGLIILASSFGGLFTGGSLTRAVATSPYFAGKLALEAYLEAIAPRVAVARFANVYGPPGPGQQTPWRGVIADWTQRRRQGHPYDVWGDLDATRDYIHVADICNGLYRMATGPRGFGLPVHMGTGVLTSLKALAELITATEPRGLHYSGKASYEIEDPKPGYVVRGSAIDARRTANQLGVWGPRPLAQGLAEVWADAHALQRGEVTE